MMKKLITLTIMAIGICFSTIAQDKKEKMDKMEKKEMMKKDKMMKDDKMMSDKVKTVSLEQTDGEFTQKSMTLSEGTYMFEIANNGIDHNVGFVLAPKGKTDEAHHIKNAYVTKAVGTDKKEHTKKVTLEKGEYVYFCPLNPTPQYTLIVE